MQSTTKITACAMLATSMLCIANPGEAIYKQYCGACHGVDGKGAAGGAFPPLAGSEWVQGDINRVAQILIHGLSGPIEVKGKAYNLMMPPQGALSDKQKVDVLNYIRSKWGTDNKNYTASDLKKAVEKSKARSGPWTAKELLKLYPLPKETGVLNNLIMTTYYGEWGTIPDFSKLKGVSVEEEHAGFLSLTRINRKNNFGVVWQGEIEISKDGVYQFAIDADDCARLSIGEKKVVEINNVGPLGRKKMAKISLTKGIHDVKFEYVQASGNAGLLAQMRHASTKKWTNLSDRSAVRPRRKAKIIDLTPTDEKIRIYNNFIKGSSPRAIAVGFPEEYHYSFSTEHCALDRLWAGRFISAGRHWSNRGQGFEPPMEPNVINTSNGHSVWLADGKRATVQFKGYTLDKVGNPTLRYTVSGVEIADTFTPIEGGFSRSLKVTSNTTQKISLILKHGVEGHINGSIATIPDEFTVEFKGSSGTLATENKTTLVKNIESKGSDLTLFYTW